MGCCGLKYLVYAGNFLFMLSGVAMIVVGALTQTHFSSFDDFFAGEFSGTPIAIIVIGSIICLISFFGCCGAKHRNYYLLMTYSILMLGMLIAKVTVGVVAMTEVDKTDQFINKNLEDFFREEYSAQFGEVNPKSESFDAINTQFSCCGVYSAFDYLAIGVNVPFTCCGEDATSCSLGIAYKIGCKDPFVDWTHNAVKTVGILSLCLALVELFSIVFVCGLAIKYKD